MGLISLILAGRERARERDALVKQRETLSAFSQGQTGLGDALSAGVDPRSLQLILKQREAQDQAQKQAEETKRLRTQNAMQLLQSAIQSGDQSKVDAFTGKIKELREQGRIGEFALPGDEVQQTVTIAEEGGPGETIEATGPLSEEQALGEVRTDLSLSRIDSRPASLDQIAKLPENVQQYIFSTGVRDPFDPEFTKGYAERLKLSGGDPKFKPSELEGAARQYWREVGLNPNHPNNQQHFREWEIANQIQSAGEFKDVGDLQKRFEQQDTIDEARKIQSSLAAINSAPANGAGDLALVITYMKILDPNSVVREGEQEQVRQTASISDRVMNWYEMAKSGAGLGAVGDRDTPVRKQIRQAANTIGAVKIKKAVPLIQKFRRAAERRGLRPDDVVTYEEFNLSPPKEERAEPVEEQRQPPVRTESPQEAQPAPEIVGPTDEDERAQLQSAIANRARQIHAESGGQMTVQDALDRAAAELGVR